MKRNKPHHPGIIFNGNPVKNSSYLNYLGMFLVSKLDKTNESVGLIRKFQIFYQDHLFYNSTNLFFDLTQITVMILMVKLSKGLFNGNMNPFNKMLL